MQFTVLLTAASLFINTVWVQDPVLRWGLASTHKMENIQRISDFVMKHKFLFLFLALQFAVKIVGSEIVVDMIPVEVLSGTKDFQIPCNANFKFNRVYSFNWVFNGTFIHPSLNPGVTVLTDGSLNIDTVLHTHTGTQSKLNWVWFKLL